MSRPKPPLRSYQAFYSAAGNHIQMVLHVDDQEAFRKLTAAGAIDEAEVESKAKQHKISANTADVRDLTRAANNMRVTMPADDILDGAAKFAQECKAVLRRLADLHADLDKFVGAKPAGEGFVHFRGARGPGVILIDTALLAKFRAEADQTAQYLRDWSARAQSFRTKTLHVDIMYLVQIIERAAHRAGTKTDLGFGNPTGSAVGFIEGILIRAKVIRHSRTESNRNMICREIRRYRGKVKKLKNNQPN